MPSRKSNVSAVSNGAEEALEATPGKQSKDKDGLSVEDLSLPKSMVARLAKGVLPANTQIHKDALLALHKSATVFVSYIASNSNDNAQASGKKTISPQDVLAALKDAELEGFIPRLEAELKKYNETQCDKRNTYRRKVKEEKAAAAAHEGDNTDIPPEADNVREVNGSLNGHAGAQGMERPAKKLKGERGDAMAPDDDHAGEEDEAGDEQDADDPEDDVDEEVEDEEVEDDEEEGPQDETLEDDTVEDVFDDARSEISRDSAVDDPDSD